VSGTLGGLLSRAAAALARAGFEEPRRQARRLIAGALDLHPGDLVAHPERAVGEDAQAGLDSLLARMLAGEPLSRILGRREFWGLEFALSPDTLDPRPETETLVEAVLKRRPERGTAWRLADLGTGTGCVLLALLHEYPVASGVGVDLLPGAAVTARANAEALGLAGRAGFLAGDWGAAVAGRFDIITANPPYIATATLSDLPLAVRGYDPRPALDGGADGLAAYRAIAAAARRLLRPGGLVAWEVGAEQAEAVVAIAGAAGLAFDGLEADLAGIARVVAARAPGGSREKVKNHLE
jgi:release factor glutamine methyltransferase